ncbi:MAG: PEGA domain-containing protein [Deltaproteobacteria bacterium]|nr:PEGA domain-containing protein [Deltaproteobacteria bacterium]
MSFPKNKQLFLLCTTPLFLLIFSIFLSSTCIATTKSKKKEVKKEENPVVEAFKYEKDYAEGTYGWLEVSTSPQGAIVYINDKRQPGPTPNRYKFPAGTVKVSVVIKGKASKEISGIKIKKNETTVLDPIDFRDEITRPNTRNLVK